MSLIICSQSYKIRLVLLELLLLTQILFGAEIVDRVEDLDEPRMYVHFIYIPYGEAIYIEYPDAGETLIYGGENDGVEYVTKCLSKTFRKKKGEFVTGFRNFLKWEQKINTLICRYPDDAVLKGTLSFIGPFEITNLYSSLTGKGIASAPYSGMTDALLAFHLLLHPAEYISAQVQYPSRNIKKEVKVNYKEVKYMTKITTPEQVESVVKLMVLNPNRIIEYTEYSKNYENATWVQKNALMLRLSFNEIVFLFIGNIEKTLGSTLNLKPETYLKANIVEISTPVDEYPEFLNQTNAEIIVFSGYRKDVSKVWENYLDPAVRVYSLHKCNELIIATDGTKIYILQKEKM